MKFGKIALVAAFFLPLTAWAQSSLQWNPATQEYDNVGGAAVAHANGLALPDTARNLATAMDTLRPHSQCPLKDLQIGSEKAAGVGQSGGVSPVRGEGTAGTIN